MKLVWGKFRMWVVCAVSKMLCVPIKVREEYLQEHVFGLEVNKVGWGIGGGSSSGTVGG